MPLLQKLPFKRSNYFMIKQFGSKTEMSLGSQILKSRWAINNVVGIIWTATFLVGKAHPAHSLAASLQNSSWNKDCGTWCCTNSSECFEMFIWTAGGDFPKSNNRFEMFIWTPGVAQSKLYYYFWSSSPCAHVLTSTSDGRTAKLIMGQENTGGTRCLRCLK